MNLPLISSLGDTKVEDAHRNSPSQHAVQRLVSHHMAEIMPALSESAASAFRLDISHQRRVLRPLETQDDIAAERVASTVFARSSAAAATDDGACYLSVHIRLSDGQSILMAPTMYGVKKKKPSLTIVN
jgi:hypothetical protein